VLVGGQGVYRGTSALFVMLIGGTAAAISGRAIRRRTDVVYPVATIAAGYALTALTLALSLGWTLEATARSAGWGALNAVVSLAVALVVLPGAEELTGIDTYPKLLEWSDLNRPLMRRLSLEAPGTYNHTVVMANLAEAACNAIGANGLLARVGAYYHDIGKLKKPQYFVENQPKGRNPHDKLKPSTSASIIRNHVREGIELAEEYGVPKAVRAFIAEHHGTGAISYFLERAKERDGPPQNPADFAYPGPVPQTVETAVCMLADGVEAAARVIAEPTPSKIRDVIDHIVRQRMDQGQLRDAPLTLRQLEIVKEQFARVLLGMYHNRIEYSAAAGGVTFGGSAPAGGNGGAPPPVVPKGSPEPTPANGAAGAASAPPAGVPAVTLSVIPGGLAEASGAGVSGAGSSAGPSHPRDAVTAGPPATPAPPTIDGTASATPAPANADAAHPAADATPRSASA
jgi:hypothetical protein